MAHVRKAKNLADWFDQRLSTNKFFEVMMTRYWIPKNINWLWAMGVVLTALFTLLVVSGIFLLMYYKPDENLAYDSVNFTIMQEVAFGWLWRHIHAVAASMVFVIIYIHMFVAIYYGSYKNGREMIWITGMILFVCFSAEAFSGYMLPWGQMSYWAAAVITNLFGGIPLIGADVVEWVRGNYVVADSTLTRFFMLHVFLMPVIIMICIAVHFYALRTPHVNNQEGEEIDFEAEAKKYLAGDKKGAKVIRFWPDFLCKDIFIISLFMILFFALVCYHFDFAMDPINFERANNLATPAHIYPEWYFLWSYEVLRGIFFSANLGLIFFGIAQVVFLLLPWLDRSNVVKPAHKRPGFLIFFILLIIDLIVLTVYGKLPPDGNAKYIGLVASVSFLILLFVVLPLVTSAENKKGGAQ
ncbi:cytochrome bc complex cytochrome b subunit [Helicobacter saguini]|uniref:Cytochrome bc complex cytochrome b subunit n=1 Tax=Helicobacter saguini TaxID=1548018 RepID=A0A347VPQ1_9HELI|nr:cytochrome bc complex cytochrome b subunit [Helicobacter saguini]MWV61263.1 cytochrome bc complex cytochrome b subunit [Helicobacter saguini]MWV68070.1 cytochrome bc complex cytochrome b subunit [Helicobacter saguini]MWV70467.1 cytochrome bc complex cytochrome b subunit [Helicobacter saguini]MWV72368.1 cytochrome bc complex cytochrome b subunit [Helicobacter saguini]TLD92333.1 cytochrome bc complex cytochrome b subunit [Helicobacter saguini]